MDGQFACIWNWVLTCGFDCQSSLRRSYQLQRAVETRTPTIQAFDSSVCGSDSNGSSCFQADLSHIHQNHSSKYLLASLLESCLNEAVKAGSPFLYCLMSTAPSSMNQGCQRLIRDPNDMWDVFLFAHLRWPSWKEKPQDYSFGLHICEDLSVFYLLEPLQRLLFRSSVSSSIVYIYLLSPLVDFLSFSVFNTLHFS